MPAGLGWRSVNVHAALVGAVAAFDDPGGTLIEGVAMGSESQGVLELLHGGLPAASIGAALELGLPWLLDERAMRTDEVARALAIPAGRCGYWLETLRVAGFLDCTRGGYRPSDRTRSEIIETYSEETWAFLALEAREAMAAVGELPARLVRPGICPAADRTPTYVRLMNEDPLRARRFTRMLCEIHAPLAALVARTLPLDDAASLLDIGGGSGVVSIALARRHPDLAITVVDIANVCAAGREIVADRGLGDRIVFVPADITSDALPTGFDAAIECDVGLYDVRLFGRVRNALAPGGRFAIVDQLAPDPAAPVPHLDWALTRSLDDPEWVPATIPSVIDLLTTAGFGIDSVESIDPAAEPADSFESCLTLIVASAGATGRIRPGAALTLMPPEG